MNLPATLQRLLAARVVRNSAALYGVQVCRKVFPLITIPYLAHALGVEGWGQVAFVLSLGEILSLIVEFGFNLSATRAIAQERDSQSACSGIAAGVLGSQILLGLAAAGAMAVAATLVPVLRQEPQLAVFGLCYGLAQGLTPLWFFQGFERLGAAAALEVTGKTAMLAGVFWFIREPSDAPYAVAIQATTTAGTTLVGLAIALSTLGLRMPTVGLVKEALRRGWPMFLFRSAESLFGVGNAFILGLFAPAAVVGNFAIAEKISRSFFGLLNPIRESLFPRLSSLAANSQAAATQLAQLGSVVMVLLGLGLSATLLIFAPQFVQLLAGSEFVEAVTVLRILSPLPAVLSVTYSIGLQWLLPFGQDRIVNRIIFLGATLNLTMAALLAPVAGAVGMAVSVLTAEIVVSGSMVWAVSCMSSAKLTIPRWSDLRSIAAKAADTLEATG